MKKYQIEKLPNYSDMIKIGELVIEGFSVIHMLCIRQKRREEYFLFDSDGVSGLGDEALENIVRNTSFCKDELPVWIRNKDGLRYAAFNRTNYYKNLDMYTKSFLNMTNNTKASRDIEIGKGWNPNPELYKFVWWVFHNGLRSNNIQEMIDSKESRFVDIAEAASLAYKLEDKDEPFVFLRICYTRLGNKVFDYERMKKEDPNMQFVPALDDDDEKDKILKM